MELLDAVVFGGLYEAPHGRWGHEQAYGLCIPVAKGDELHMLDTYQVDRPSMMGDETQTDAGIRQLTQFGKGYDGWALRHAKHNFYHNSQSRVRDLEDLENFKLLVDLTEYRGLKRGEDARLYRQEDIYERVKLFREHGYSWDYGSVGVTVVKKDAEVSLVRELEAALQDTHRSFRSPSPAYNFSRLEEQVSFCEDAGILTDELEKQIDECSAIQALLTEQQQAFRDLLEKYK